MSKWVSVLKKDGLQPGTMVNIKLDGKNILIANIKDHVYAMLNDCPHLGCLLHRGSLQEYKLTCPCHDWIFDIRNGEFLAAPEIKIPTFPVKVENGEILVNLKGVIV